MNLTEVCFQKNQISWPTDDENCHLERILIPWARAKFDSLPIFTAILIVPKHLKIWFLKSESNLGTPQPSQSYFSS